MALTNRQWGLAAGLACAAIAVAYLPPEVVDRGRQYFFEFNVEQARSNRKVVSDVLHATNERLTQMEIVDSLMRLPAVARATAAAPTFVFDARVDARVRQAVADAVTDQWETIAPARGDVRFVVAAFIDTATEVHGVHRAPRGGALRWALPSATDGRTCLTMLTLPVGGDQAVYLSAWRWQRLSTRLLGPCAFYAAFGLPGPAITAWLAREEYAGVASADFGSTSPRVEANVGFPDVPRWQLALLPFLYGSPDPVLPRLFPCVAGDLDGCEGELLDASGRPRPRPAGSLDTVAIVQAQLYLGLNEMPHRLLSDLVHGEGRARFARFWTSTAPVDSAFQTAYGRRVGAWASDWARVHYGAVVRSSRLRTGDVLSVAVAVVLALALVLGLALRRQIG